MPRPERSSRPPDQDPGPPSDGPLTLRLFGSLEVVVRGTRQDLGLRRKARWLLAALVLRRGQDVDRRTLAAQLWPDSQDNQALYNLRRELSALRQALGPESGRLVNVGPTSLGFDTQAVWIDLLTFEESLLAGDERSLERAVALHRAPLLEECLEEWALTERTRAEAACADARERLAVLSRSRGDHATALRHLEALVQLDPLREGAQRRRIEWLAEAGDTAAAVRAYRELGALLRRELGAEPDEQTTLLFHRIRAQSREAATRPPVHHEPLVKPSPLPAPLTRLIGREAELGALRERLDTDRLVTVTGVAGVGKTRLAVELAHALRDRFTDGAVFVELAPLVDVTGLPPALAVALGLRGAGNPSPDATFDTLRFRQLLLVLDNCEHLLPELAEEVRRLLAHAPALKILATSRQSLALTGEAVWQLQPLDIAAPAPAADSPSRRSSPAVELLRERAEQVRHDSCAAPGATLALTEICAAVEGLPLALELIASRVRFQSVEEIAADLRQGVLRVAGRSGPTRHRSLAAALDGSHSRLTDAERTVLRRLTVFAGRFGPEAARDVCATDAVPLPEIEALIDRSLLQRDEASRPGGASRFRMLEVVRQYAGQHLKDSGDDERTRDRHLQHFLGRVQQLEPQFFGGGRDGEWLGELALDDANLAAAFEWSTTTPARAALAVRLGSALQWYWFATGTFVQGRRWLARALADADELEPLVRARAQVALAYLSYWCGDHAAMQAPTSSALDLYQQAADDWGIAYAGSVQAYLTGCSTGHEPDLMVEALAAARRSGDEVLVSIVLWWRGMLAWQHQELAVAQEAFDELHRIIVPHGHATGIGYALLPLGRLALDRGDAAHALEHLREAARVLSGVGNHWGVAASLIGLVAVAGHTQQHETGLRLLGAAERIQEVIGATSPDAERALLDATIQRAVEALGPEVAQALRDEGRQQSVRELLDTLVG